jgi:hypothetical protein
MFAGGQRDMVQQRLFRHPVIAAVSTTASAARRLKSVKSVHTGKSGFTVGLGPDARTRESVVFDRMPQASDE